MTKFVYRNKQTIQQKSGNEQRGVTVAEETETVAQGIAVDGFPVAVYKCRHKQQQSTLRLVEIGNHHLYDVVPVTRCNYDLGAGLEHIQNCFVWDKMGGESGCHTISVRLSAKKRIIVWISFTEPVLTFPDCIGSYVTQ